MKQLALPSMQDLLAASQLVEERLVDIATLVNATSFQMLIPVHGVAAVRVKL